MTLDFQNKVVLVTGASKGIGRAIAIKFAQKNARVIVNYSSSKEAANETLNLMGEYKKNATAIKFDVSLESEVNEAIEKIEHDIGQIDILVNNAGIAIDGLLMRYKAQDFDRQLNINLKGAFLLSKAVVKGMMKKRAGRIINITSVVGQMGNAGQCAYSAAKAGLIGMTKSLALELSSRNILVNAVAPGFIQTDMTSSIIEKGGDNILSSIPLGKVGEPDDIANAVIFLASDMSSYITGQVLGVNGGLYL